ncbi:hypothetical protein BS50DRAFT_574342 [Corynespora cassiicola Philippines]|uniref:Uncharacterized protein n=1 Tax=Corynespora cassiicola Philippines TaxID=1448308 RepID=A0A2T2NK85_CORCC|nr:hypothetical protein BS50DRAFT_574342 [Corynespora cassiicola Philippines]
MATFSLDDFDAHIEHLRSQLRFFTESLDATDHKTPDWLSSDLLSLRNKTGRLQDEMQRFRDQLESEGIATKQNSKKRSRLSIENTESSASKRTAQASSEGDHKPTPIPSHISPPIPKSPGPEEFEDDYYVEHVDITAEVQRRLRENRVRRLMDTPSKAQKRKFDDTVLSEGAETEEDRSTVGERTPTKRIKTSGGMEGSFKRKETGLASGDTDDTNGEKVAVKKRRVA